MKSSYKLAIQIGGAISGSFKSAIRGSSTQLVQLGSSIRKLRSNQKLIGKFELNEANLGKARLAYQKAANDVMRLRKEIASTTNPSKKLTQAFETAKNKAASLSNKLGVQKGSLRQVSIQLDKAGIDTRKLATENRKLGTTIDRLHSKSLKLNKAIAARDRIQTRRADLRGQLFDMVALGATVAAPVKIAVDFEQSIAKLGAITKSDETAMGQMEATARKLGESTMFSASQAASAMTFLGMAGFKTNQILEATPGMLSLAQASGSDLAETADIASNILSGFSLEASKMGKVGDVLSATFTSSNTTLQMLGETLKYAAPVASAAGASIEEVAAMAGLLGNVGIQGSMAGTALRAAFLRLSAPPKEAADAMDTLGLSTKDAEGNLRPIPQFLKEIGMATQDMGSAEQAEIIKKLFGSEAAAGMTELLKQSGIGALDSYIDQLQKAKGTTREMASKMSNTTAGALKRLGSALESVAISLGDVLLPTVASGAEVFAVFASGISKVAQEYPFLTKVIVGATAGLVGIKVVTIATSYAFTFLKGGVMTLVVAYRTLNAGLVLAKANMVRMNVVAGFSAAKLGLVTAAQWALNVALNANPIGLIVAGLAALAGAAYVIYQYWEPLGEFFTNLWQGIKDVTKDAVDWIIGKLEFLKAPMEFLGDAWNTVTGWFGDDDSDEKPKQERKPESPAGRERRSRMPLLGTPGKVIKAAVGSTMLATTPIMANHQPMELQGNLVGGRTEVTQHMRIDAPITINAQPGSNEKAIAQEVQKALDEQKMRAMHDQRSQLFDDVSP